jgi:3-isopropylmalate/(R)-2-methylmalate dehydratase small subunit
MQAFDTFTGTVMALDRANIDTDAIIPKEYLKSIARTGFGKALFSDWRYLPDGTDNPEFKMNQPAYRTAEILVAGNNFGCGSSREHAVWAIQQAGFRTVIAPWRDSGGERIPAFADIFANNSGKNGLLLIELPPDETAEIMRMADAEPLRATIHLEAQTVTCHANAGDRVYRFEFDPALKERLLTGRDEIALTLQHEVDIDAFENKQPTGY